MFFRCFDIFVALYTSFVYLMSQFHLRNHHYNHSFNLSQAYKVTFHQIELTWFHPHLYCWFHMVLERIMWWNHFPCHYDCLNNALCGGDDANGFLKILLNMCFVSNMHLSFSVLYSNTVLVVFYNGIGVFSSKLSILDFVFGRSTNTFFPI